MKQKVDLLILFIIMFAPIFVNSSTSNVYYKWVTGIKINIITVLDSSNLESEYNSMAIIVRLFVLNGNANNTQDREVQYKMSGNHTSSSVYFEHSDTTGNFLTESRDLISKRKGE